MIPIFDLDDTLYSERSFVESGFHAVARELQNIYGWSVDESLFLMRKILISEGRGLIFDRLLQMHGESKKSIVKKCIHIYRHHVPKIKLSEDAEDLLKSLEKKPYLVTDGHKIVQANKIKALNLENLFEKVYITNRYGIKNAKPSIYCFDLIRRREKCLWENMFYVGDNPDKDFVALNRVGVVTVRIKTGEYAKKNAKNGFEAKYIINSLGELKPILMRLENG